MRRRAGLWHGRWAARPAGLWLLALCATALPLQAESLRWAVTTTLRNSGLAAVLLPAAEADLGFEIDMLVVGTGQAAGLARAGDVDAIMVHARPLEEALVAEGVATHRREIMYNDFVLVGPRADPAGVAGAASAAGALRAIAAARAPFVSRGDDSGTHERELALWQTAGVDEDARVVAWYKAVGAGMGTALNIAAGLEAYVLSDRASWLAFANKGELAILYSGDPVLFNQYSYLPVNSALHPHVRSDMATQLENWLTSARAKALIDGYKLNGEALFTYNAQGE